MWGYAKPPKPPLPLNAQILAALKRGPVTGQTDLMQLVLGSDRDLKQCESFTLAMRYLLSPPIKIVEERIQIPGTGHECTPAFEHQYRLATMAETIESDRVEIEEASD